ncbi:hypothetical protein D3C86_1634750 [compost metagenome]
MPRNSPNSLTHPGASNGIRCHSERSSVLKYLRVACKPQTWSVALLNRSSLSGILNSAVQPSSSIWVFKYQIGFQLPSHVVPFSEIKPSLFTPATEPENEKAVNLSLWLLMLTSIQSPSNPSLRDNRFTISFGFLS